MASNYIRVNKSEENLVAESANKLDKINKLDRTITKNDEIEILEARKCIQQFKMMKLSH